VWIPVTALLMTRGGTISLAQAAVILVPMCLVYAFYLPGVLLFVRRYSFAADRCCTPLCDAHQAPVVCSTIWIGLGWLWASSLDSSGYVDAIQQRFVAQMPILFFRAA
jgi:hypothetical protein